MMLISENVCSLAASGINRADLFVTTKVWHDKLSPDALRRSFETSLRKLHLDHIDLFLVHWPSAKMNISAPIAVHQVEYHPFLSQTPMLDYLRRRGIPMTAYAPLAQGRAAKDPVLARIGEKHSATAAQIAIAWLLDQENVIAIPKAARSSGQRANLDALNIHLDEEDRAAIAALPKDVRYVDPPFAPDWEAATL